MRVGVHYCSVNVADHLIWTGQSEMKPKLPFVPGFEISGEILEINPRAKSDSDSGTDDEEEPYAVGDRVLALNKELFNGFSSECIVDQKVIGIRIKITLHSNLEIHEHFFSCLGRFSYTGINEV